MLSLLQGLASLAAFASVAAAQAPVVQIERELVRMGAASVAFALSPDGGMFASCGEVGDLVLLGANDGHVVRTIDPQVLSQWSVMFAPDGRSLVVPGNGVLLRIDTATGAVTMGPKACWPIAWSADGRRLAAVTEQPNVSVFDAATFALVCEQRVTSEGRVAHLALSPDGTQFACAFGVYEVATGERVRGHQIADGGGGPMAWLQDGRLLRVGDELHGLGAKPERLRSAPQGMAVDPAGKLCVLWDDRSVLGFADGERFEVDVGGPVVVRADGGEWARLSGTAIEVFARGKRVRTLPLLHRARPFESALTGDGRYVVFGERAMARDDGVEFALPADVLAGPLLQLGDDDRIATVGTDAVQVWSLDDLRKGLTAPRATIAHRASSVQFSDNGRFMLDGEEVRAIAQPELVVATVRCAPWRPGRLSPDGRMAATTIGFSGTFYDDGGYGLWRVVAGDRVVASGSIEGGAPVCSRWSPDGTRIGVLARASKVSGLLVYAVGSSAEVAKAPLAGSAVDFAWLDDQRVLLLTQSWGPVFRSAVVDYDLVAGRELARIEFGGVATALTASRDGRRAAVTLRDRVLVLRLAR